MSGDGQSSATTFPPPLWGRDREGGTTRTAFISSLTSNKCQPSCPSPLMRLASCSVLRGHPPPCPSPTGGEGTVWRVPSQLMQCACGWLLKECANGVVRGERQAQGRSRVPDRSRALCGRHQP